MAILCGETPSARSIWKRARTTPPGRAAAASFIARAGAAAHAAASFSFRHGAAPLGWGDKSRDMCNQVVTFSVRY